MREFNLPGQLVVSLLVTLAMTIGCVESSKPLSDAELKNQQLSGIDRGRYVLEIMGCNDCHTPDYMTSKIDIPEADWLTGGSLGFRGSYGTVYPSNLRLLFNNMSEDNWLVLARQMRKDSPMAWVMLPKTSEQDLRAIYQFVKYLGPKGTSAPESLPPGVTPQGSYVDYPDPH